MVVRSASARTEVGWVRLEVVEDAIAVIRLDRPPVNALDRRTQRELHRVAAQVATMRELRAAILYGGAAIFSAGGDIKEMAGMSHAEMAAHAQVLQASFTAVAEIPVPVIAAVNGVALGGGCELALTADFRICATDARIGLTEISLGVIPGAGGTQRLTRLVGTAVARDLIYSGRAVSAAEAERIGLVDAVVEPEDVFEASLRMARRYVGGPAVALAAAKRAINAVEHGGLHEGLAVERAEFVALFDTRDRLNGMRSFVDRGPGMAAFEGC